jgi:hypothetical protein
MQKVTLSILVAATVFGVASASADLPPDPDYVEPCTVQKKQSADTTCESCGAYHGEPGKCASKYADSPFKKRCATAGASVWDEVWCRPLRNDEPRSVVKQPPTSPGASCTLQSQRARGNALLFALVIIGSALLARRSNSESRGGS